MNIDWVFGVLIVLILLLLVYNFRKKRIRKQILNNIESNWGKQKDQSEFYFGSIEKYFRNNNQRDKAFHIISDRSADDIDLDEIFRIVDRTSSKIGQQYLYYKIRTIEDRDSLLKFNELVLLFEKNENLRLKTQSELNKINTRNSYYFEELVTSEPIEKPKIIWLVYTLSVLSLLFLALGFISPVFFLFLFPIVSVNMVFHYRNKWNISKYINGVSELTKAFKISKTIVGYPEIKEHFSDTTFIKEIEKIKRKTEFISLEKNLNNDFAALFWLVSELVKIVFNLEYLIFYSFIESITSKKEELRKMFEFIGEIDSAISTGSLKADDYALCNPEFIDEKRITVTDISHPLIENCVTNSLSLTYASLLLTGSNMSGKSTFIRSVSISSILAQTLNICFAKAYTAPFFKLYSSIRITDDVLEDTSYYLKEVLTIRELIDASIDEDPCLFVLDEIFKGTNTIERISGGKAILSYLNKGNNIVLVSTHDIELTDLLSKEKFKSFHFSEQIENNELAFDHKLKEGRLKTRNAIKILELYNYPSEIIEDAKATEKTTFGDS